MVSNVGVFTVATNIYLDYWEAMVLSADRRLFPGVETTYFVFTDRPELAQAVGEKLQQSRVVAIGVPAYGWPDVPLLTYELVMEHRQVITGDVLVQMDADMIVVDDVPMPDPSAWPGGLAFVRHPGFRRPRGTSRLKYYMASPHAARADFGLWRRFGGLGAWEERPSSQAFVARRDRNTYFCGAIWMGIRQPLLDMCEALASATRRDMADGVVAQWHDESHLNCYAASHEHAVLDSQYAYAEGYPNLSDLRPVIYAVEKGAHRTR